MSFPNRSAQIAEIQKYLEWWLTENEEREEPLTTGDLAIKIVDGYHDLLSSSLKKPVTHLHQGMAFKVPWSTKVHFVSYVGPNIVWVTTADSGFGWIGREGDELWRYAEESRAKAKENPTWKVGDKVSRGQRAHVYTIVATSERSALLYAKSVLEYYSAESNDNLEKYYKREKNG